MNIFNNVNKLILYSTSKHNVLALVFVLLIVLVVQYPAIFSKSANTVFGKTIILLIIILLTNYNTLVGLAATIVALVFYVYLFDTGYEGFVENTTVTEKKTSTQVSAPKPEQVNQTDIMMAAKNATASQDSKTIHSANVKNSKVQPSEPIGTAKSTSDATTLKPAPATATAPTN